MRVKSLALVLLALVACNDADRGGDKPSVPDACSGVAAGVNATWARLLASPRIANDRTRLAADRDLASEAAFALVHHCREDAWSAEMIACLRAVDNIEPCKSKLTADQLAKIGRDVPATMYPVPIMPETTPAR